VLLLLVPFFMARSLFGLYQVQAFSYGNYRYLLKVGAVIGLGILALGLLPQDNVIVLASISALLALIAVIGGSPKEHEKPPPLDEVRRLPIPEWLAALSSYDRPVRLTVALANSRFGPIPAIISRLTDEMKGGAITRFGRRILLWYEPVEAGAELIGSSQVAVAAAGCLRQLEFGQPAPNGRAALAQTLAQENLTLELRRRLQPDPSLPRADELKAEFARRIPEGTVLDIRAGRIKVREAGLQPLHLRQLLIDLSRLSRGIRRQRIIPDTLDVAVYAPRGKAQLVFVYSRSVDVDRRAEWRNIVDRVTLQQSVGPEKD
jgi:hypothetical protein